MKTSLAVQAAGSDFVIGISFDIRHSDFVILT